MSNRIYINNDWLFTEKFTKNFLSDDSKDLAKVSIPHTVKETPYNYFDESAYQMVSGYKKRFKIPKNWQGKSVRLTFEGVAHEATVYINGKEKAVHKCGYTAFTIDVSSDIEGKDAIEIAVKVDSRETLNQPPFGFVIDYMTYGGIYRDVYFEVSEKTYIERLFLYSDIKDSSIFLCSHIRIMNPQRKPLIIKQKVNGKTYTHEVDGNGGLESQLIEFRQDVGKVKLWDIESPKLYEVVTEIYDTKEKLIDTFTETHGFRKSEFRVDGYYLNGKKVKIRGLNRHQSYPYVGYAMPASMQRFDADILKKELGLNAVRTSHYPQSHDFIRRCDELGLLVFMEIPGWQHIGDDDWKKLAIENTKDMVREFRNHPSIILWGVRINESQDDDEFYKKTNEIAHRYDFTRPTGGVRFIKKSHLFEDVYTYNEFVHEGNNRGCDPKKNVTSDVNKPYLISEYCGHMYPTKTFDNEGMRRELAVRHANILDAIAKEEDIAGSFGWCMFDYNTHKDFGSGDRICYHGVMDMFRNRKLASYVYSDETTGKDVFLEVSSAMDIGEHPASNRGDTYIFSNADSVRMYKNDKLLKEYFPWDSSYVHLSHGPIKINDYIGSSIEEGEDYKPWVKRDLKKLMNKTAEVGMGNLPLKSWILAGKLMLFGGLKMSDAVRIYTKYIGDWGGSARVYKFEAIKNGKVVKKVIKEPVKTIKLSASQSTTALKVTRSYDVALVRIQVTDQNGNVCPFFTEPVTFETRGPIEVIGPKTVSLQGGRGGVFVKTVGAPKEKEMALLRVSAVKTPSVEVAFTVEA
jgi:beta-galactosidase